VRQRIAGLRQGLTTPEFAVSLDLENAFGAQAALPRLQRLVSLYGELFQAWSALRKAAHDPHPLARKLLN
jgi:hypothetical protein